MADDSFEETPTQRKCRLNDKLRWRPTSEHLLKEAENQIMTRLTSLDPGKFIDVGCVVGNKNSQIWTQRANIESPNTPIVLLHGFGSGSALWCLNIDSLAAHRPVYAIDMLGFGRSSRPTFSSDAKEAETQFVSAVEAWRKEVGLEKFIIVGHSFGGFLAFSYALTYPERIVHLILADPWGINERPPDALKQYGLPLWAKAVASVAQHFNPLSILRAAGPLGPRILENARPDLTKKFAVMLPDAEFAIPKYLYHCNAQRPSGETAFHHLMSGFGWAKHPIISRLESFQHDLPMTFIYGDMSWVDNEAGFLIQESRKDFYVDVQVLEAASHHVYADRAKLFNEIINAIGQHSDCNTLPKTSPPSARPEKKRPNFSRRFGKMSQVRTDGPPSQQGQGSSVESVVQVESVVESVVQGDMA